MQAIAMLLSIARKSRVNGTMNSKKQKIDIRNAVLADFDDVVRLMKQLNPKDKSDFGEPAFHTYREILNSNNFSIIVVEIDNSVVSTCYLNHIPNLTWGCAPYAFIENVITDSAFRRQGLGTKCLKHAMKVSAARGCFKIMLMTSQLDEQTLEFYKNCGFSNESKEAFVYYKNYI